MDSNDTRDKLIKMKEKSGLSLKDFAAYFGIPYRTMQDWYYGKRKMPDYLLRLMYYKFETDKMKEQSSTAAKE